MELCSFCGWPVDGDDAVCSLACWYGAEAERFGSLVRLYVRDGREASAAHYARKAARMAHVAMEAGQ